MFSVSLFKRSEVLNRYLPPKMFAKSVLVVILATSAFVTSFPDGAPADTCVKNNRPKHGKTQPKGLQSIPYQLVASSDQFGPGAEVQGTSNLLLLNSSSKAHSLLPFPRLPVVISGSDVFRGFFLQARDAQTNEWIGEWQQTENTKTIPECSAITHGDNRDKLQAVLVWKAPNDRKGYVYFT